MNTQIKFSDVIRYALLGAFILAYIYFFAYFLQIHYVLDKFDATMAFIRSSDSGLVVLVGFFISSMFLGLLVQVLRALIEYYPMRWMERYVGHNQASFWQKILYIFFSVTLYGSIFYESIREKYGHCLSEDMPIWLYLTESPYATLNYVRGRLSKEIHEDSSSMAESYYYQELFMGLSYAVLFVPLVILIMLWNSITWTFIGSIFTFTSFVIGLGILKFAAHVHSRTYLRYLDAIYNLLDEYKTSTQPYFNSRLSTVYVLIRTIDQPGRLANITRAVESVLNQNYPNKHIIIYEDIAEVESPQDVSNSTEYSLIEQIERELEKKNGPKPDYISDLKKISTYRRAISHGGASGSALEIRQHFISEASENDVAVLLDDDDYLARTDALLDIVVRIKATNADICLTTFRNVSEMGYVLSNGGGKFHNLTVKKLSEKGKSVKYYPELIFTDTLGWTKCYSYSALKHYVEGIKRYETSILKDDYRFTDIPAFEDFPDFVCYLFPGMRVSAVAKPTHCYFNRKGSITGSSDNQAFYHRRDFLAYTLGLANSLYTSNKNINDINRFIIYKIGVICNIIKTKFKAYSIPEFIALCMETYTTSSQKPQLRALFEQREVFLDTLRQFITVDGTITLGDADTPISIDEFLQEIDQSILKNLQLS